MLSVSNLRVSYGGILAVSKVDLEVGDGKIVALVGGNGMGKSSTLRAIAGLNIPEQGEIRLREQRIEGLAAHRRVSLGLSLVPEGRRLFPRLTVERNLELGAYTRDSDLAGAAALTAIPRPIRSTREAFAISLGRRLTGRHGALILRPAVLRRLDVIDTLLVDPRVLYTDELTVTLIDGVTPARRAKAWEAARAALADGTLTPGWHKLSAIPGAGRLRWPEFARMLRFGLPNGLNWFLEFSAFLIFINLIFADLGTLAVAAFMAVMQVNSISFMPAFGLSSAGAILVGQAIGAGDHHRVPAIVRRTGLVAASWQGLVGIVYFSLPVPIMALFAEDDTTASELATLGAALLAISAAWQLFDAAVMTLSEALRAAGDTAWVLWARVALAWVVWLPLSLWVVKGLGAGPPAATACMVVYFATLTLAIAWRFRSGAWRHIDLTGTHGA